MRTVVVLAGWLALLAGNAFAATQTQIGSWVLSCSGESACRLRAEKRFVDKAGITVELEVLADGAVLVPVLALRGLSTQVVVMAASMGSVEAWMQLDGGARQALDCAPNLEGYFCTPRGDAARSLAAGLPAARAVTARVVATVSGMKPLPPEEKTLALTGTREAMGRLRVAGAEAVPDARLAAATRWLPQASPQTLAEMADKALKAAGYPKGVGDLEGLMAKYRGK